MGPRVCAAVIVVVCWAVSISVNAAPASARTSAQRRFCVTAFPAAGQRKVGGSTTYNRQASVQNVLCAGIGSDVKFDLDSGVACTLVSAAIGPKFKKTELFIDGSCSAPTLAAHPDIGESSAIACGMLSDLLGAAPSPFIKAVAVSAGLTCAFGRPFGGWIESLSERKAAQAVIGKGKCLRFTTHSFPLNDVWEAVACSPDDRGFFTPVKPPRPIVRVTTRVGHQRITLAGRVLASTGTKAPFTSRATNAPELLAEALGSPRSCRPAEASRAGHGAALATYPTVDGVKVRADLTAVAPGPTPPGGLCAPGAGARLRQLRLTGDAVVVDDLGAALRIGARTASLPKAMQPDHYSVLPTVPVQDPCAAAPVATELGDRLLSVTETSARPQRVASIVVVPSDEEECLTASTRDQFNAAVLADPCALVGLDFHAMTPDGCHGVRDATFAVTPVPSGAADVVPGAIAAGTSSDGTVAWSFNANAAIVEGDGLRVDIASGTGFDPELSARFLTTADRVASATTYDAQPHDSYMSATTAFRVARPDLGSTLLGGPETGADTAVWSVYRDGRRLGYAVFYYHTELADTVQFPYVFARFEQHYRQLCGVTSVLCP